MYAGQEEYTRESGEFLWYKPHCQQKHTTLSMAHNQKHTVLHISLGITRSTNKDDRSEGDKHMSSTAVARNHISPIIAKCAKSNTIQYNIQYNAIQIQYNKYNTIQHIAKCDSTIQYNTIQYETIQYNTIQ